MYRRAQQMMYALHSTSLSCLLLFLFSTNYIVLGQLLSQNSSINGLIVNNRTHIILASSLIRPGQTYRLSATILQADRPITLRASIKRYEVELSSTQQALQPLVPSTMLLKVPSTSLPGEYRLRVEGNIYAVPGGSGFLYERSLIFDQRSMTILISTERPVYKQGQTIRFRCVPITTGLKAFGDSIDVHMLDARGNLVRRWLSRQSNNGAINLEHQLSDQPAFGRWRIEVIAQGQKEQHYFLVEEYHQTRFEVQVKLPALVSADLPNINGEIQANFTSGIPVMGNLTLQSIITCGNDRPPVQPSQWNHLRVYKQSLRLFTGTYQFEISLSKLSSITEVRQLNGCVITVMAEVGERFLNLIYSGFSSSLITSGNLRLNFLGGGAQVFQPQMPLRLHCTVSYQDGSPVKSDILTAGNLTLVPRIHFSDGKIQALASRMLPSAGQFTSSAFKSVSKSNNEQNYRYVSDHNEQQYFASNIDASIFDEQNSRAQLNDVWQIQINLREELSTLEQLLSVQRIHLETRYSNSKLQQSIVAVADVFANHLSSRRALQITTSTVRPQVGQYLIIHVRANYPVRLLQYAVVAKGLLLHCSHERVTSYVKTFDLALSPEMAPSATIIVFDLTTDGELIADSLHFPVDALSGQQQLSASKQQPKFELELNERKDKTGETIEITVKGEPGSFAGISAFDQQLLRLWPNAQLTGDLVQWLMQSFDRYQKMQNGGHIHRWIDRKTGAISRILSLPSSGTGVDTNRTFQSAGLLVLTDGLVHRRQEPCSSEIQMISCLDGTSCYLPEQRCNRHRDCSDGSDESNCDFSPVEWPLGWILDPYSDLNFHNRPDRTSASYWNLLPISSSNISPNTIKKPDIKDRYWGHWTENLVPWTRESRVQRVYEGSWLWQNVFIGPLGYYIFRVPVPSLPTVWKLTAFSIGPRSGLTFLQKSISHSSIKRFRMDLELPRVCVIGEQIALRISLFNEQRNEIEVLISLASSPDYRFVHVEENGLVSAYSPRTSSGEHQHLLLIKAGSSAQVHMPIVAQRLGIIEIEIRARTQAAQYQTKKHLHVLADGVPQFMHSVALIDLSQGAQVIKYLHTNLTDTPIVPFQRARRYVFGSNRATLSVVGDILGMPLGQMPLTTRDLLRMPHAPAEQSMFNFALNLYGLLYLRLSGQRNAEIERPVFAELHVMYERQLSFQRADGAFRQFRWSDEPSVWLTAFCARILHKATFQEWEQIFYVEKRVIERAIAWILQHQNPDGSFYELRQHAYDRKMGSTTRDAFNKFNQIRSRDFIVNPGYYNVSLTAHIVITLAQVRDLSGELGARVATARWAAQRYLEGALHAVKQRPHPYELAIVTYALTLVNSVHAGDGFNALDERMREVRGMRYWAAEPVAAPAVQMESSRPYLLPRTAHANQALDVEATAYALLVHIHKQAVIQQEIVDWLNTYRTDHCGWSSTQDTLVALQALFEFALRSRVREVANIELSAEAPAAGNLSFSTRLVAENLPYMQRFELPHAYGPVVVRANGAGLALVQLHVQFNVDWPHLQLPPPLPAFSLQVLMHSYGRNASHLLFNSCQRWTALQESSSSGMAVLAVTIPTGYFVHQQVLDDYVRARQVRNLREAKFDERMVEFYFDYLDSEDICVSFTVQRWHPVANLTRYISARVYDYYAPERFNETMINAYNLYVLSICHVCGSYQCPYCPAYSATFHCFPSLTFFYLLIIFNFIMKLKL